MQKSIKNEMLDIIDHLHWRLEQAELELRNKIKEVEEKNIETTRFSVDNRKKWFRTIVNYMTNGLTYQQAVQLLCEENNFDRIRIEQVLDSANYQRKAIDLYSKIFMVKTLKKADFTNKKIADIMKISACTVSKLLKCSVSI